MGFDHVECEGDAQTIVKAIHKEYKYRAWFRILIEEAKHLLKTNRSWSVHFIHREGNHVVHMLTKHGFSFVDELVWIEEIPSILTSIVTSELRN